jgi:hypothetical protein
MSDDHKDLIGLTITDVREMTDEEAEAIGVDDDRRPNVLHLSNGTFIFALRDDEGNGWGVMLHGKRTEDGLDVEQNYI